jgi:hypothetical protein
MKTKSILAGVIALLVPATLAFGADYNLQQKKDMAAAQKKFDDGAIKKMTDSCGGTIKASVDWKTFDGNYEGSYKEGSAVNFCGSVLEAVADVCKDKDGKTAVGTQVKTVTCTFEKGADKAKFELKDGALNVQYDWKSPNISSEAKKYLMGNLH